MAVLLPQLLLSKISKDIQYFCDLCHKICGKISRHLNEDQFLEVSFDLCHDLLPLTLADLIRGSLNYANQ